MRVDINRDKYLNKIDTYHTVDESGEYVEQSEKMKKRIERENRLRDICLNCKKPTCNGDIKCFNAERKKINAEG